MTKNKQNYASETVAQEVSNVLSRRQEYYLKLLNMRAQPGRRQSLSTLIQQIAVNDNDVRFLTQIKDYLLRSHRGEDWLGFYRTYLQLAQTSMNECLQNEIKNPLNPQMSDIDALNSLNFLIKNAKDSQILLDMIYGHNSQGMSIIFTTTDEKDFLRKNKDIQEWYKMYFDSKVCFFDIQHILEVEKRL